MIDRMLDYDKPISEQTPSVRDALKKLGIEHGSAQDVVTHLGSKNSQKYLTDVGIPGIRYLDEGSRNTALRPHFDVVRKRDGTTVMRVIEGGEKRPYIAELTASGEFELRGPIDKRTRNFVVFPGEEKKVRILERDGQTAPQRIAQALEAAPTLSVMEQRIKERFGDFAQAYNLGLPNTPEYRRIVQEVTAQGPLSDDALREAVKLHPAYLQAGGKSSATELRQANRGGASALVDSLSGQGIKTRVETSKSPGSRSTYIHASKGDKTVKIRLSDHLPAESGRVYGANDIMTTPQHWKSAAKRALKLLGEEK